ncbi:GDSL-type esterase/lipase family protein [Streptomyces cocklensis]|uniref:Lysophospholipase L1 n=1 Tax=Actinacidiphila cocklensis TaxID=887465 RepID=A0A9W4DK34_9ACTN|nr:GDSL-type esterase/lipase family protein [Actinacidiphila cocklensis]MDD1061031.1 GDSL-type esterase/lipase family protein [Actinacidiphila cocklensis]CAG6391465.1 Lysophospholipase L1 [Actinacidiphila cocklensis]
MSSEAQPARRVLRAPRLLLALLLLAFGAVVAVGGARSAAAAPQAAAAAPVRIMPLGDSITGSPGCWRALLWNQLQNAGYTNIDFVGTLPPQGCGVAYDGDNEGHGGILATNIANQNQLPAWLSATTPDIVLMHLGTNDVWSNIPPSQILAAFTTMVGQMRASNPNMKVLVAQIIPMNPPTCPECAQRVIDFDAQIPAWAQSISTAQSPVTVVDQWTGFDDATDTGDGVHPNDAGIVKVAARWYPPLAALLTPGSGTSAGTSTGTSSGTSTGTSTGTSSGTSTGTSTGSTGGTGGGACTAALSVTNSWQGGYQAAATVTAVKALTSWTVTLTGVTVTQAWNGSVVTNPDGTVVIHSAAWNGTLAPGASTTFGFLASSSPTPAPTATCSTP